jgi:DNA polymerase sigma
MTTMGLTSNKSQNKRHDCENSLQITTQHTPADRNTDNGKGCQHSNGSKLIGPEAFDKLKAVLTLVTPVKLDEEINPYVIRADLVRMVVCWKFSQILCLG